MNNRLKIEVRQKQLYYNLDTGNPIIVDCAAGVPSYISGTVPLPDWLDVTEFTEGLDEFHLNWNAVGDDETQSDTGGNDLGSNYQKGVSADLRFREIAFKYVYDWMMMNPCQILNSIEVRITDLDCQKSYRIYEIKVDNLKYAPEDEPCIVSFPLREADDVIHAFQKTAIEDDWQQWFNSDGLSAKDHPTFSMIVEKKPKFFMAIFAALIYVVGILSIGVLTTLSDGRKWIRKTLGFTYFCPSPFIRTYIENICDKYGFTANTIFDDVIENNYRDACMFFPGSKTYKNFLGFSSTSTKFIWDNRTLLPFVKFLNQLKKLFNAEWYVTPNKQLVFQPRSYFDNLTPLYDFTALGADKLWHLVYDFNGKKKAAYGDYEYQVDPQDTCSNELKWRYNDIVDYDGPANNPMLEGHVEKNFDFAMTAFHNDGSSEDFLEEGVKLGRTIAEVAILAGLVGLFVVADPITAAVAAALLTLGYVRTNDYVNNFFNDDDLNGMVRTSSSEINVPRILLYDRNTPIGSAKVVAPDVAPPINPYYNIDSVDYYAEHPAHDADPANYFGTVVTKVYNYPTYIDANYTGNLFDRFHEYDNPLKNPLLNQTWEGSVDLCCDWLNRLGVWDGDFIRIGHTLILENRAGRLIKGRIDEIDPNYKDGTIALKGTVLK